MGVLIFNAYSIACGSDHTLIQHLLDVQPPNPLASQGDFKKPLGTTSTKNNDGIQFKSITSAASVYVLYSNQEEKLVQKFDVWFEMTRILECLQPRAFLAVCKCILDIIDGVVCYSQLTSWSYGSLRFQLRMSTVGNFKLVQGGHPSEARRKFFLIQSQQMEEAFIESRAKRSKLGSPFLRHREDIQYSNSASIKQVGNNFLQL